MLYHLGRRLVLGNFFLQFLLVIGFIVFSNMSATWFLVLNLVEHLVALLLLIGGGMVLWGLLFRKEYQKYIFHWLDILLIIAFLVGGHDAWHTIFTPHPMLHEIFFLL